MEQEITVNTGPELIGAVFGFIGVLIGAAIAAVAQYFLARQSQVDGTRAVAAEAAASAQEYMVAMNHLTKQLLSEQHLTHDDKKQYNENGGKADDLYHASRKAVSALAAAADREVVEQARVLHNVMVEMSNSVIEQLRAGEYKAARREFNLRSDELNRALNVVLEMVSSPKRLTVVPRRPTFQTVEGALTTLEQRGRRVLAERAAQFEPLILFLEDRLTERVEVFDEQVAETKDEAVKEFLKSVMLDCQAQHNALRHLEILRRPPASRTGTMRVLRSLAIPYASHPDFQQDWMDS